MSPARGTYTQRWNEYGFDRGPLAFWKDNIFIFIYIIYIYIIYIIIIKLLLLLLFL
jgi:hypothetical protein